MQHRAKLIDKNDLNADAYADCTKCPMGHEQRKHVRCGWVREDEREGRALEPAAYPYEPLTVCAGYLASMPQVIEAARAASWRRDGALREFYDGNPLTPLTKWAVDVVAAETKAAEQDAIREASRGEG